MERTILNKVRVLLGMEIELESMKLEDGVTVIEAEVFEGGESVFVVTEDEQKIPLPVGEYALEDGNVLVVSEEGIIGEVKAKEEEVAEEDAPEVEEEVEAEAEVPSTEEAKPIKKVVESVSKETFFSEIEALVNENKELKAKLEEVSNAPKVEEVAEVEAEVELSEVKPLVHNPEAKEAKAGFKYAKNGNKAMNNIFAKFNK